MNVVTLDKTAKLITGGPWNWQGDTPPAGYVTEEWALANGYTWKPSPPAVPASVDNWRFRAVCQQQGLTAQIEAFIASQPEPPRIALQNFWEFGTEVPRDNDMVDAIGKALGKTPAQIDAIFIAAASIVI